MQCEGYSCDPSTLGSDSPAQPGTSSLVRRGCKLGLIDLYLTVGMLRRLSVDCFPGGTKGLPAGAGDCRLSRAGLLYRQRPNVRSSAFRSSARQIYLFTAMLEMKSPFLADRTALCSCLAPRRSIACHSGKTARAVGPIGPALTLGGCCPRRCLIRQPCIGPARRNHSSGVGGFDFSPSRTFALDDGNGSGGVDDLAVDRPVHRFAATSRGQLRQIGLCPAKHRAGV